MVIKINIDEKEMNDAIEEIEEIGISTNQVVVQKPKQNPNPNPNHNPNPNPVASTSTLTNSNTPLNVINGWTKKNQTYFKYCLYRLKYYRIINNFFFFELKKREGQLSWAIIVLSSFSSVLSLVNTQQELFQYSSNLVKWFLVLITVIITLIGAYIKKQQFIDRINNIDRYLQQLNQFVEELNITFILEPEKRESYDEFCKKYIPIIKNLSVSPASFSPKEWKHIVYTITTYYPELIQGDGSNEELLWPWYYMDDKEQLNRVPDVKRRPQSKFGDNIIKSYDFLKSKRRGYSFLHWFNKPDFPINNLENPEDDKNDKTHKRDKNDKNDKNHKRVKNDNSDKFPNAFNLV